MKRPTVPTDAAQARRMHRSLIVLLALWMANPAPAARAEENKAPSLGPGAPPAAEIRYRSGRALYAQGRYPEAAGEFRVALGLWPQSARLAYNLGRSLERASASEDAVLAYSQYIALSPDAPDRAQIEDLIRVLLVDAARGSVHVRTNPAGARVLVDHGPAAREGQTPMLLVLAPGPHAVRVELAGREAVERSIELGVGQELRLDLVLGTARPSAPRPTEVRPIAPTPALSAASPVPSSAEGTGWQGPAGIGALGGAAAALGVGAYFAWSGSQAVDESRSLGPEDTRKQGSLRDELSTAKVGMGVGFGLGAALGATGAYLLLSGGGSTRAAMVPQRTGAVAVVLF